MNGELRVVSDKLKVRFRDTDGELVEATVGREADRLSDARVQSFVPLLVERAAKRRLREVGGPS